MLKNKKGLWISDEQWNFKSSNDLLHIVNISKTKVLGTKSDGHVILEDFEEGKAEQLWRKGMPNSEGYFTLENSKVPKIMTAISGFPFSSSILQIEGNITLR